MFLMKIPIFMSSFIVYELAETTESVICSN